jgi:hypothetical protein
MSAPCTPESSSRQSAWSRSPACPSVREHHRLLARLSNPLKASFSERVRHNVTVGREHRRGPRSRLL